MLSKIAGIKQAMPYMQKYREKLFVIKIGGSLFERDSDIAQIASGIASLHHIGIRLIVIHGGGPQVNELAQRLDIPQKVVAGRRVTTPETLEVTKMVFAGKLNIDLTSALANHVVLVAGITGLDGSTIMASRRPPIKIRDRADAPEEEVDFGLVGDIISINSALIDHLHSAGYVPVLASLARGSKGEILNVNADVVAQHVAVTCRAEKYINMMNMPGILKNEADPQSLLPYADIAMIEEMKKQGTIFGGMLPKVESCIAALRGGVKRVHIISGRQEDSLLTEVFTNEGCGTLIVEQIGRNGNGNGH